MSDIITSTKPLPLVNLSDQRSLSRWYPLIPVPKQLEFVRDPVRFKVCNSGRRSGKTERVKRSIVKMAMSSPGESFFIAAPTHNQVKSIYWKDLKLLSFSHNAKKKPSESELIIFFDNDASIQLLGLDKPERIEGIFWSHGVVDEIANVKSVAWNENIRPALDTFNPQHPGRKPGCFLIGVPEGISYFYDIAQYAQHSGDPEWKFYNWPSADVLPKETIEAAKKMLSPRQFRQEYLGSFESAGSRITEDYDVSNLTNETIKIDETLHWSLDFNYAPLSSVISVIRDGKILILDEIVLTSAVAKQAATEFVNKYSHFNVKNVTIYGDCNGFSGRKHNQRNDYADIQEILTLNGWKFKMKVPRANPLLKVRHNTLRAKVLNANNERSLFVNREKAVWSDKALLTCQVKEGSSFIVDDGNKYSHIFDAIGYLVYGSDFGLKAHGVSL